MNPNNCDTCNWKKNPEGGHCYMFRDEPSGACAQHTGRLLDIISMLADIERPCCGTFAGSQHRKTCVRFKQSHDSEGGNIE